MTPPPKDSAGPSIQMTEGFGSWFRHLRENVAQLPQQSLALKVGDVSDSTISRIENGEGSVQATTLNRLAGAFRHTVVGSLMTAVAKSFAADNEEDNGRRSEYLRALAAERGRDSGELVIGISLEAPELIVTRTGLTADPRDPDFRRGQPLYDQLSQWGGDACIRLAARYQGVVLAQQGGYGNKSAAYFQAVARTVRGDIERHVDPLAGVTELGEAMLRASALVADVYVENGEAVREALGWVILLANAVGAQLNTSPYTAWLLKYRENEDHWRRAFSALAQAVRNCPEDLETVLKLAQPWLEAWAGIALDKPSGVRFTRGGDGTISWMAEPDWVMGELVEPAAQDLWLYGGQTGAPSAVLASCGIQHLYLQDQGLTLSNPPGEPQAWFRNPASADYAIVNVGADWVPVQLF
ncbi:helix-turn-helix domain-containing protein [Mycobacteroides abscessus]|uniref:helix-turn-helix domain-containing protein n=1 Tax=Mycobacteroides abscessus TaxID=36809 RepID=UPI0002FDC523|nr:helix-turn-helix transcriptional regulator [Mycobacteroides abscessus]